MKRRRDPPREANENNSSLFAAICKPPRELSDDDKRAINDAGRYNMITEIDELQKRAAALGMTVTSHTLTCAKFMLIREIQKSYGKTD